MSYGDAAEKTGASTATISRVKRSLYYGNGGYRTALDRLSGKEDKGDE
jgi:TrpR-related protein YerC/YecD